MRLLCTVASIWLISRTGYAKFDGSIPSTLACESMTPGHGTNQPQNSSSPYYIDAESSFFIEGISLPVYLESYSALKFKGFYCQARNTRSVTEIEGIFKILTKAEKGHSCSPGTANAINAISHSSVWSNNPKTSLELNWIPPNYALANVRFRCTFVQSFSTFWLAVESDIIKPLKNASVAECCSVEEIERDCVPLCRAIDQEPENLESVANVLRNASRNDCSFKKALRCTYWSKTAENIDISALYECCDNVHVSVECWSFCAKDIYGTMNYTAEELNDCLAENPRLSSCIVFPESQASISVDTSAKKVTNVSTTSGTTAAATASAEFSTATSYVEATTTTEMQMTQSVAANAATTASVIFSTDANFVETITASQTPTIQTVSTTTDIVTTTATSPTTSSNKTSAPTVKQSTPAEPVTTFATLISTAIGRQSTQIALITSVETFTNAEYTDTFTTTVPAISTAKTTPANTDSTPYPPQTAGTVIFDITTVVEVTGATQNESLRSTIFIALEEELLIPALDALTGYTQVNVGTQYYDGSLVVVSEGVFLQQSDGSIIVVTDVKHALDQRLLALNNEIASGTDKWTITGPVEVERKAINGLCQSTECEVSEKCVEVGSDDTVCVCLDSNNVEVTCGSIETGLTAGAVAGIAIACVIFVAIIAFIVVFFLHKGCWKRKVPTPTQLQVTRHFSADSNDGYINPDSSEAREEPLYTYIPNDLPPPPAPPLPPGNNILPSYSKTYEEATPDNLQELRENTDGYMEATLTEKNGKYEEVDDDKTSSGNEYAEAYAPYKKETDEETPKKTIYETADDVGKGAKESAADVLAAERMKSNDYLALDGYEFASGPVTDPGQTEDKSIGIGQDTKRTIDVEGTG